MMILLILITFNLYASEPLHWSQLYKLGSRHEFYQNNEVIDSPKNSWQLLFSLIYIDKNLNRLKDCVYYRVPGSQDGTLKIKMLPASSDCESHILKPGDREINGIKTLEFSLKESKLELFLSQTNYKSEKWEGTFQGAFIKPKAKMKLSSANIKGPKIVLLTSVKTPKLSVSEDFLKTGTLCHNINEDCQEVTASECGQCQNGWYEVPNGCSNGPKYCGSHQCGLKGQPACRRGMKWQRRELEYDCRVNSSFAYCSEGVTLVCEGQKAYCR